MSAVWAGASYGIQTEEERKLGVNVEKVGGRRKGESFPGVKNVCRNSERKNTPHMFYGD